MTSDLTFSMPNIQSEERASFLFTAPSHSKSKVFNNSFFDLLTGFTQGAFTALNAKHACKFSMIINSTPKYQLFKKPIYVDLENSGKFWFVSNKDFNISTHGFCINEAIDEFKIFIDVDSQEYLLTENDKLTKEAIELKNKYLEYLGGTNIN